MLNHLTLLVIFILWGLAYALARRLTGRLRLHPLVPDLIGASGVLAAATAAFFWQVLLVPNTWMPAGGGDLAPFLFPNYHFAAEQIKQGVIPLWNPHLYGGVPFAADLQNGLFYPLNLLLFFVVREVRYEHLQGFVVLHFWLAGTTMYACLRGTRAAAIRLSPLAAFAGALAFAFSDLFIVQLGNLNMIAAAAWLPLVFLCFEQAVRHRSAARAALAGIVLAIAFLAGHVQITLMTMLLLGLYALWVAAERSGWLRVEEEGMGWAGQRTLQQRTHSLLLLLVTVAVAVGLSALLLLPAYELSQQTPRALVSYPEAAQYSLHPGQLVGLLLPNFFGRDPAVYWGPWERVPTGYVGVLTLGLALLGAALRPRRRSTFFAMAALAGLLLALGGSSIAHGWLYAFVPGFNQLRAPARFVLLMDFALAVLAARGLAYLLRGSPATRTALRRWLPPVARGIAVLLAVGVPLGYFALLTMQDRDPTIFLRVAAALQSVLTFALLAGSSLLLLWLAQAGRLRGRLLGIAAIALLLFDLFSSGSVLDVGQRNPTAGFEHPQALAFLQADPGIHRIEVATDVWHLWQPNSALLNGLYDVWGLYNPLVLADTSRYWQQAGDRAERAVSLSGGQVCDCQQGGAPAGTGLVPVFEEDPNVTVYLNQMALPRLLFVGQAIPAADHEGAWQALTDPAFDPSQQVVLEGMTTPQNRPLGPRQGWGSRAMACTTSRLLCRATRPAFSFCRMPSTPAGKQRWMASRQRFFAPTMPSGPSASLPGSIVVRFHFRPQSWTLGLLLSGGTALSLLIAGIVALVRRSRRRDDAELAQDEVIGRAGIAHLDEGPGAVGTVEP